MAEPAAKKWLVVLWGSEDAFSLEHRLFNSIVSLTALLWYIVAASNLSIELGPWMVLVPLVTAATYTVIYLVARLKGNYAALIWPAALLLLISMSYSWIGAGGSGGGAHIYFAIAPFIFLPFVKGAQRIVLLLIYAATVVGLLTLEYLHPDMIGVYPKPANRFADLVSGVITAQIAMAGALVVVFREFRRIVARTENLRAKGEERFAEVSETIPAIIAEVNRDMCITYANRAGKELSGYGRDDMAAGLSLTRLVHADDLPSMRADIAALLTGAPSPLREYRVVTKDGTVKTVLARAMARLTDGVVDGMRLYMVDITEQKNLEERYRQAQKMESIGMLAGGVAHDFNNILTAILGYARLIEMANRGPDKTVLDPGLDSSIKPVISASLRASDLIKKLLVFSRREQYMVSIFDVNEVVGDVIVLLEHSIDKKVELVKECSAEVLNVEGDRSLLESAILNLAVNARDAMPQGGRLTIRTASTTVSPKMAASRGAGLVAGAYVSVTVADNGTGMDENVKQHLFEPFFTTKERGKGTGLGLASVYGTIQGHHGFIDVDSAPGVGTRITFHLPQAKAAVSPGDTTRLRPAGTHTGHLLIVEDEDIVREVAVEILKSDGYSVTAFGDALAAVEYFRNHAQEICGAIVDLIMPRMNGRECLDALRRIKPDLPAILATGHMLDEEAGILRSDRRLTVIHKPYEPMALLRAVAAMIESRSIT
jgi:PAS domain S-box-containing protein